MKPHGYVVHLADYEVDHKAGNKNLDSVDSTAAESGERLLVIEDVLGHMQHVLEDVLVNETIHEPSVDKEHEKGAGSRSGQHVEQGMVEREIHGLGERQHSRVFNHLRQDDEGV